jgi:hypothetical protein
MGWLTFSEDGTCKLVNLTRHEHPKYEGIENYCTWSGDKETHEVALYLVIDNPIFILKNYHPKVENEAEWVDEARITKNAL